MAYTPKLSDLDQTNSQFVNNVMSKSQDTKSSTVYNPKLTDLPRDAFNMEQSEQIQGPYDNSVLNALYQVGNFSDALTAGLVTGLTDVANFGYKHVPFFNKNKDDLPIYDKFKDYYEQQRAQSPAGSEIGRFVGQAAPLSFMGPESLGLRGLMATATEQGAPAALKMVGGNVVKNIPVSATFSGVMDPNQSISQDIKTGIAVAPMVSAAGFAVKSLLEHFLLPQSNQAVEVLKGQIPENEKLSPAELKMYENQGMDIKPDTMNEDFRRLLALKEQYPQLKTMTTPEMLGLYTPSKKISQIMRTPQTNKQYNQLSEGIDNLAQNVLNPKTIKAKNMPVNIPSNIDEYINQKVSKNYKTEQSLLDTRYKQNDQEMAELTKKIGDKKIDMKPYFDGAKNQIEEIEAAFGSDADAKQLKKKFERLYNGAEQPGEEASVLPGEKPGLIVDTLGKPIVPGKPATFVPGKPTTLGFTPTQFSDAIKDLNSLQQMAYDRVNESLAGKVGKLKKLLEDTFIQNGPKLGIDDVNQVVAKYAKLRNDYRNHLDKYFSNKKNPVNITKDIKYPETNKGNFLNKFFGSKPNANAIQQLHKVLNNDPESINLATLHYLQKALPGEHADTKLSANKLISLYQNLDDETGNLMFKHMGNQKKILDALTLVKKYYAPYVGASEMPRTGFSVNETAPNLLKGFALVKDAVTNLPKAALDFFGNQVSQVLTGKNPEIQEKLINYVNSTPAQKILAMNPGAEQNDAVALLLGKIAEDKNAPPDLRRTAQHSLKYLGDLHKFRRPIVNALGKTANVATADLLGNQQ